ncbi:MAG: hypothetical protein WEF86_08545 [Gemmatimonadota bacterium]
MTTCPLLARLVLPALIVCACAPPGSRGGSDIDQPDPGPSPAAWDEGTVLSGRRMPLECPNGTAIRSDSLDSAAEHDSTIAAPLAGSIQLVPEYHDCQRLTMPAPPHNFGPIVAIFASEALGSIGEDAYRQTIGTPVAQILNLSSIPYGPLGIRRNYSCLYLRLEGNADWQARLTWRDEDSTCPPLTPADWNGSGPLRVRPLAPSPDPAHYPAVARWDREDGRPFHYIGIKCLNAWCEIGRGNFNPSKSHEYPDYTGRIKGWYDEQQIAVVDSAEGTMTPGVLARIVPQARLDTLEIDDFSCLYPCPATDGWVHVATTSLDVESPYYKRKMNFDADTPGNTIHLRRHVKPTGEERWESRIISARGDTTYHETERVDHSATQETHAVPASARWHWLENDERTWTRCAAGCCETSSAPLHSLDDW